MVTLKSNDNSAADRSIFGGVLQIYAKATKPAMVCEREEGTKCPEPFIIGEGDWKDRTDQLGQTKENNIIVTASSN